ncbi:MAG: radical SAM protein [Actinomycetota bacterium]|nr:radical SAM protein [Actinomycetota bacterium]
MKQLSLHVTDSCNSKCSFCVVGSPLAQKDSVQYADLLSFLIENADEQYESVNLHGGEPTIHPRLFPLLEAIQLLGYPKVQIQTNGRKLKNLQFTKRLAEHNVRLLVVSLHGATAATQDALAQAPGGFEETLEGIRNAKHLGIKVRTNTVLTKQNLDELPALCELLFQLNVDHMNISNIHPAGSAFFGFDTLIPTMEETKAKLFPIIQTMLDSPVKITLEGFPFCVVTPYEKLAIEYEKHQVRMLYQQRIHDSYGYFMDKECRMHGPPCTECTLREKCGGVYKEYIEQRGWGEFAPISS